MKEVIVQVPDQKLEFFMELIENLDFTAKDYNQNIDSEGDTKEEIVKNLTEGFKEMKLFKEGHSKGTPLKELLNEL